MAENVIPDSQDGVLQGLMSDIAKGVKTKLVEPVIGENRKLGTLLEELHNKDQKEFAAIGARLESLEAAVRETPLLVLAAIKEAINQAGMDEKA
ncbi:MAG: hypothetical protein VR68_05355 [Peptococcaceae bacterium BRH_c4a]|nr:MAG: hypothetical protein VR68_05355 [Peptococcaceae bacterium BRH_c4a]